MKRKIINIICVFVSLVFILSNFSFSIFTPHIYEYQSNGQRIIAYAELNAATITLPSGKRIQSTNVNGGTEINIQTVTTPLNIILVMDVSGSMHDLRIEIAKQSAINLVDNLFNVATNIKISLIAFSGSASIKIKESSNQEDIKSAINNLHVGGSTNMLPALEMAQSIFAKDNQEESFHVLINLTDGSTMNAKDCFNKLKLIELQNKKIKIYNILIETNSDGAFKNGNEEAGTTYKNIKLEQLVEIYDEIYNLICIEAVESNVTDFIENAQNYFITNDDLYMFLDQEMLQGSKLELEYIINLKSSIPCTKIELQEEVDKNLNFEMSSKMISEDKSNEDYGWQVNEDLSYKSTGDKKHNLVLSITQTPQNGQQYVMERGKSYQVKLLLSTLLTSQIEDMNYKNKLTFRINEDNNLSQTLEAMEVNIIPPFGEDKSYIKIWIVILVCILTGISIIIYIKIKKKLDNNK